jgi:ketosteroid isomerase-like protein
MNITTKLLAITVVSLFSTSPNTNAKELNMTMTQQPVLDTVLKMGRAYNAGDIDTVMTTYEPAAVVMFEPGNESFGAELIKEKFTGSLAINPQFEFGAHEVIIADTIAVHTTPWSMTGKTPDGQNVEQSGLSIAVLRRQNDGSWLLLIDNPFGQNVLNAD